MVIIANQSDELCSFKSCWRSGPAEVESSYSSCS
jgi:hypothetical protein